jgi:hypothetical protein
MLKLVKTLGGQNGAPNQCEKCSGVHFIRSGIAWHCGSCGLYHPVVVHGMDNIAQYLKNGKAFIIQQLGD